MIPSSCCVLLITKYSKITKILEDRGQFGTLTSLALRPRDWRGRRSRHAGVKEERSLSVRRGWRRDLVFPVVGHVERSGGGRGVPATLLEGRELLPGPGLALVAGPAGGHRARPGGEVWPVLEGGVGERVRLVRHVSGAGSAGRGCPVSVVSVAGG